MSPFSLSAVLLLLPALSTVEGLVLSEVEGLVLSEVEGLVLGEVEGSSVLWRPLTSAPPCGVHQCADSIYPGS